MVVRKVFGMVAQLAVLMVLNSVDLRVEKMAGEMAEMKGFL